MNGVQIFTGLIKVSGRVHDLSHCCKPTSHLQNTCSLHRLYASCGCVESKESKETGIERRERERGGEGDGQAKKKERA